MRSAVAPPTKPTAAPLAELEASLGGRVGVFALDPASGAQLGHRADERFAMCSTFKWALAAAVLARVDQGGITLADRVSFGEDDLLSYAPAARENVSHGYMTVEALAGAAVTVSDNTAANLLLPLVGGPAGLTGWFREVGDTFTRLDRDEPTLNTNIAGDERDTTTPRAMVGTMHQALIGTALAPSSRDRLIAWLEASRTGGERLRAGIPSGWRVGDKTGTCENGAANDVAIAWPPNGPPILIASYLSDSTAPLAALNTAHAEIARIIVAHVPGATQK
jgi:beta-lactamase class A